MVLYHSQVRSVCEVVWDVWWIKAGCGSNWKREYARDGDWKHGYCCLCFGDGCVLGRWGRWDLVLGSQCSVAVKLLIMWLYTRVWTLYQVGCFPLFCWCHFDNIFKLNRKKSINFNYRYVRPVEHLWTICGTSRCCLCGGEARKKKKRHLLVFNQLRKGEVDQIHPFFSSAVK